MRKIWWGYLIIALILGWGLGYMHCWSAWQKAEDRAEQHAVAFSRISQPDALSDVISALYNGAQVRIVWPEKR